MSEDYNPLNPVDYWSKIADLWYTTLTEGPRAGLEVVRPIYVEHVTTGAMFIPGAGSIGTAYKIRGGVKGGISLSRTLSRPGGRVGLALQQVPKHRQTGIRIVAGGRILSKVTTIETGKLVLDGQYTKAGLVWFGPPGSLLAYERYKGKPDKGQVQPATIQPAVVESGTKPAPSKKKPSKMSAKQKKRLWRMGLRWCRKHNPTRRTLSSGALCSLTGSLQSIKSTPAGCPIY